MPQLKRLTIRGYKSIRALEGFELRGLNVLIGANGAGKSNFISVFRMLAELAEQRLQLYVREQDGPDALLFGTRKRTMQMDTEFYFGRNGYLVSLQPAGDQLVFSRECIGFDGDYGPSTHSLGSGHEEARLRDIQGEPFAPYVRPAIHEPDRTGAAGPGHARQPASQSGCGQPGRVHPAAP